MFFTTLSGMAQLSLQRRIHWYSSSKRPTSSDSRGTGGSRQIYSELALATSSRERTSIDMAMAQAILNRRISSELLPKYSPQGYAQADNAKRPSNDPTKQPPTKKTRAERRKENLEKEIQNKTRKMETVVSGVKWLPFHAPGYSSARLKLPGPNSKRQQASNRKKEKRAIAQGRGKPSNPTPLRNGGRESMAAVSETFLRIYR